MTSGLTEVDNHDLSTSSTVSSSPAISNSSSAASSSSTLPVHDMGEEQQQQEQANSSSKFVDEVSQTFSDTESTNVSTSSSMVPATPARKPGIRGLAQQLQDYSSVRVAVRLVVLVDKLVKLVLFFAFNSRKKSHKKIFYIQKESVRNIINTTTTTRYLIIESIPSSFFLLS